MLNLIVATLALLQSSPETVRFANGDLAEGYSSGEGCVNEDRCGTFIREEATGQIIMFRDRWIHGYVSTGRGQEVVKQVTTDQSER